MKNKSCSFICFLAFSLFLNGFCPSAACAHQILFYFNSNDGTDGALLECVTILQNAGNQVTAIDVRGRNRDPRNDNWGAPYDQVWDMRFVDPDSSQYGQGDPDAADYFNENWRAKAVSFLNHCGNLFVAGEHYPVRDRDEGLYSFLKEIHAVKNGYNAHAPSPQGNDSTTGEGFYPVRHGLGPVSFYCAWTGGIPRAYLTGTSYVETEDDWEGDDVDRSIVCGWKGNQLGGAVTAGPCGHGKLFMVWDATMWTLWQPGMYQEESGGPPVWDEDAWVPGNIQSPASTIMHVKTAKKVTTAFFPSIAQWLGGRGCPCTEAALPVSSPAPQPVPARVPTPFYRLPALPSTPATAGSLLLAEGRPSAKPAPSNAPLTIVFTDFPINIYMGFRDGMGEYQLNILDSQGLPVQTVFDKRITTEKEQWAAWDGKNGAGMESPIGLYYAVLSKDGRFLRKIVLSRVRP
ncbi:MAG TPA: hypothetical protein VJ873_02045 [bacterium]|nr:hypothetical protein [bacterium]